MVLGNPYFAFYHLRMNREKISSANLFLVQKMNNRSSCPLLAYNLSNPITSLSSDAPPPWIETDRDCIFIFYLTSSAKNIIRVARQDPNVDIFAPNSIRLLLSSLQLCAIIRHNQMAYSCIQFNIIILAETWASDLRQTKFLVRNIICLVSLIKYVLSLRWVKLCSVLWRSFYHHIYVRGLTVPNNITSFVCMMRE